MKLKHQLSEMQEKSCDLIFNYKIFYQIKIWYKILKMFMMHMNELEVIH